jgi:hypothetical protein
MFGQTGPRTPVARGWVVPTARRHVYALVVLFARRRRGPCVMRALLMLIEDLLDVVGRPYDGIDHVVMDDVHETMLDPIERDHPLAAIGVVAQTPCDVVANLNLHCRLAEVDVAARDPGKPYRSNQPRFRTFQARPMDLPPSAVAG